MLSIAKLRVGQEAYTLSGVAQSLDDYYTGRGEASGSWLGVGAERLGLHGEVDPDDLRAVLAGMAPGSGGLTPDGSTVRAHPRRVPGFDLTFKPPKSVSVLWAVSDDPRVQGAILDAGDAALAATISWLEREAIHVRRGSGDAAWLDDLAARDPGAAERARVQVLPGRGVVAAAFRHRTSRSGDPLLHWHTLVANLVEGPDGRWGAFVHPEMYRAARAAGEVFQAVLRGELTERLGLEWRPGRHVPEVAGVPQAICDLFSKRSAEVDAWLDATGTPDNRAGRQAGVLATRRTKPELEDERLDAAWKVEAEAAGWGPAEAESLVTSTTERTTPEVGEVWRLPTEVDGAIVDRVVEPEEWIASVLRDLTDRDSTFTRPQVVQAVAARIGEGTTMATIDRTVARVLASPQAVPVADEQLDRWTSTELVTVERRFFDAAAESREGRRPLPERVLRRALAANASLGEDQAAAVHALASTRDGVAVLVGPAGTGKTYTLDAARLAWTMAGRDVVGAAPSARAAQELHEDAHIPASTIHRLLGSWERGFDLPTKRTVLVVDEAAMTGTRELEAVTRRVLDAGGQVVLVGDHRQLPEVTAGGGFAALIADKKTTVAELVTNRRQRQEWEREALTELRDGHVPRAVAAYRAHDRVVIAPDPASMIDTAVDAWLAAHRQGSVPVLLAATNETVDALTNRVRKVLINGNVLGPPVPGPHRDYRYGERVMTRINDYQAHRPDGSQVAVLNGHTGTLVGATPDGLVVRMDHDNGDVLLSHEYVAGAGLSCAYASTAHKAQGGTWDLAITVGLDGLYREAGYLVLSRGRDTNLLVVSEPEMEAVDRDLARHDSPLPLLGEEPAEIDEALQGTLSVSRAKQLALTRDPTADTVNELATMVDLPTLELRAAHAAAVESRAVAALGTDPRSFAGRLDRIEHTARHVAVGQRVKAWDRHNIGTIVGLDDTAGTVHVHFVAPNGNEASRKLSWDQVTIVHPVRPMARHLPPEAAATLDRLTGTHRQDLERWRDLLAAHGVEPDDARTYSRAARIAIRRAADHLTAAEPDWLTELLGTRPTTSPAATQVWDDAVETIAAARARQGATHPAVPLGPDVPGEPAADVWAAVAGPVGAARIWLDSHTDQPSIPTAHTRSRYELTTRLAELDDILDTAPADQRGFLARLQAGGGLDLGDTADLLRQATATQDERRRWILHHWPHVVEYAEVTAQLAARPGPDLDQLLANLSDDPNPLLSVAAAGQHRWLKTLLGALVDEHATTVPADVARPTGDVANYRHRWGIDSTDALGEGAFDLDQVSERHLLGIAIEQAAYVALDQSERPVDQLLLPGLDGL